MKFVIPFVALLMVSFASCQKELRSKTYLLTAYNNSGLSGKVSFVETKNKGETIVRLEAEGLQPGVVYLTHLHTGTLDSLTGTLIYFDNVQSGSGGIVQEETWAVGYEEALVSNTCFTIHDPGFFANNYSSYFLAGNTGKNAP